MQKVSALSAGFFVCVFRCRSLLGNVYSLQTRESELIKTAIADKAGGVVNHLCSFFCFGGKPSVRTKQGGVSLA